MNQGDLFGTTLADARATLKAEATQGAVCPCCGHFAKVYKRKFNSGMALAMIYSYPWFKAHPGEWLSLRDFLIEIGKTKLNNYGVTLYWSMYEKRNAEPIHGERARGLYQMTEKGIAFVECKLTVPSHANEYLSEFQSFEGEYITIREALGKKFNYPELMREVGAWRNDT
jgi:hypothetical protein